jgi:nucleoside-triphosphatase
MKSVYLLTGRPGTGKTSLIKQVVAESELKTGGFYTEEIRSHGSRTGFKLLTLEGQEAVLAHIDFNKRFRVGKYGVDIASLDKVGVPALRQAAGSGDLIIIDEIGKMELFSADFRRAVLDIIGGDKRVLGTIMFNANPWADDIKRRPQVNLVTVTRAGYQQILDDLHRWLAEIKSLDTLST